jgi:Family of unknown function (DUF6338)
MPSTVQALLVLVTAALPGALYIWASEQEAGPWGVGLSDRVLRFIGASAVFHAVLAPATYNLWRHYVEPGTIAEGRPLPWWVWPILIGYVVVPFAVGRIVGRGAARRSRWATLIAGRSPHPSAWDHVFTTRGLSAWVRIKLTDGSWIGGGFGQGDGTLKSYAGAYSEQRDIYLAATAVVDAATGNFEVDPAGHPQLQPAGALVPAEQIAYLLVEELGSEAEGETDDG